MKQFITLIFLILLVSCGDEVKTNIATEDNVQQKKKEVSAKAIENLKYNDYILSNDAEEVVRDWAKYQELSTQISFLKTADMTFFTEEKDTLKKFLDSLKVSVPTKINTEPVNARIAAMETKMLKLNNDLVLDNYSADSKLISIKEFLSANSNLIFVINKKLEFDNNDVGRPENE